MSCAIFLFDEKRTSHPAKELAPAFFLKFTWKDDPELAPKIRRNQR
jgi:hypothetical protein